MANTIVADGEVSLINVIDGVVGTVIRVTEEVGIDSIVFNEDYTLTFNMTNGDTYTTGSIRGAQGETGATGATGPQGPQGPQGEAGSDATATDVQIDGTSIVSNGVANIPVASASALGVFKVGSGLFMQSGNYEGTLAIYKAGEVEIKEGNQAYKPIVPQCQHQSVFYGLAKAAGDATQSQSSNPVGTYTEDAKTAICEMLNVQRKKTFELIADVTTSEDLETVDVITDSNGHGFNLTKMLVRVWFTPSLTGINNYVKSGLYIEDTTQASKYIASPTVRYMSNGSNTFSEYKCELICGFARTEVRTGSSPPNTQDVQSSSTEGDDTKYLKGFRLQQYNSTSTLIPSGTRIKVYGVRV